MLRKIAIAGLCLATTAHSATIANKLQKRDGAHAHDHGSDAGYDRSASYEPPVAEYGAPATSYDAPAESYGVSYEEEALPDLTPIIIAILALTGLSLLFPEIVDLTVRRKKRHAIAGEPMLYCNGARLLKNSKIFKESMMMSYTKYLKVENLLKNIIQMPSSPSAHPHQRQIFIKKWS